MTTKAILQHLNTKQLSRLLKIAEVLECSQEDVLLDAVTSYLDKIQPNIIQKQRCNIWLDEVHINMLQEIAANFMLYGTDNAAHWVVKHMHRAMLEQQANQAKIGTYH